MEIIDDSELPEMIEIDLEGPESIDVDIETGESEPTALDAVVSKEMAFGDNLAEHIDEKELKKLGTKLKELVDSDNESRQGWYKRLKRGMESLGVYAETGEDVSDKTAGVTRITHPVIMEAVTQFQSRAFAEIFPSKGPVKASFVGEDVTDEKMEQGDRVEKFMNFQLTVEDRDYYDERDQMLYMLPLTGSEFDKQYYDRIEERVASSWVRCDDFIVNAKARSLRKAPRLTHVLRMTEDEYEILVTAGMYRDVELGDQAEEENEAGAMILKMDEADSVDVEEDDDIEHEFYEIHTKTELSDDIDSGACLPYIITIERTTGEVVGIRRNWKENDSKKKSRLWFSHKKFLPGFGFYGFGLLHVIGTLGEAATEILNILLDSGAYASLQGGFKSKDAKLNGDIELTPGQWTDTEMTAEELAKAFYTPPFKEPSQTLFTLLGQITNIAQRFASTTEVMTGTAGTSGPVGNIMAQIEQGSKVFSGIHRRLHKAVGDELINIAALNGEHLPDAYPFTFGGKDISILRSDFDDRIDIIPVSDPNIFSASQRLAMAQTMVQTIQSNPTLGGDLRTATVDMLKAMHFPNPEKYFPLPAEAKRCDPVTEGVLTTLGKPVKAFIEQDHQAHNAVHQMQLVQYQQQNPASASSMQSHIQEHLAMSAYIEMQTALAQQVQQGMMQIQQAVETGQISPQDAMMGAQQLKAQAQQQIPAFDWNGAAAQTLPIETENQIAKQAAMAAQQMMAQMQQAEEPQDTSLQVAQINADTTLKKAEMDNAGRVQAATLQAEGFAHAEDIKAKVAHLNKLVDEKVAVMETALKRYEMVLTDDQKRDLASAELLMERQIARENGERELEKEATKAALNAKTQQSDNK